MSTINTANSSTHDNIATLLRSSSGVTGDAGSPQAREANTKSKDSSPATVVDLSDRAKAILERNKADKIVADRLSEQLAVAKGNDNTKTAGSDRLTLDDILGGGSQLGNSNSQPKSLSQDSERQQAIIESNRQPDGTVKSFSVTERDVLSVPSTPAEIEEWFNTRGKSIIGTAERIPDEEATGIADAVRNKTIKIFSAKDIPGLNFTNTYTFSGGEGGAQGNGTHSYNRDADIFKDPNTNYRVDSTGTVLAWPKPTAS